MKHFLKHLQTYIFRGFLAIIPIFLCILAVQLLYTLIDRRVMVFLNEFIAVRQIPGLGILLVLASLYLIGLTVSNIIGRQILHLLEGITKRIPVIKSIYSVGKQLSHSLGLSGEKMAFKKAVLVRLNNDDNMLCPAFITGEIIDERTKEKLIMVLLPTVPTPYSGFVVAVKASQIIDPGWTIEECLKALISVGIILPSGIHRKSA